MSPVQTKVEARRLASTLPPLLVEAERVAATVAQGVHGRKRVGMGETFWQFRPYETGDSYTSIDWRQSAKRNRHYVRQYEWEAAQTVFLWRDGSDSMHYASSKNLPSKSARSDLLLLALASLLVRSGERLGLLGATISPSQERGIIHRIGHLLAGDLWQTGDIPELGGTAREVPRYANLVLMGDFLEPLEDIQASLAALAQRGLRGHVLQILDPAELTLPFSGRVLFRGVQDREEELIPNVESVRGDYHEAFQNHCNGLADLVRSIGWTFDRHTTDQTAESALLSLYVALAREVAV